MPLWGCGPHPMHLEGTPLFPTVAAPGHWPIRGWLFPEAERGLCSGSCPSLLSQASPAPCPLPAPLSTLPIKGSLPHEDSREPAPPWARALSGSAAPTQHPQGPMPSPQDQAGPWQSRGLVRVASSQPWGSDPSTPEQVSYLSSSSPGDPCPQDTLPPRQELCQVPRWAWQGWLHP